ncbi:acyl carrier protein [Streptomyces sp. N35]|uniref:acyl carrier protein n=1 Tax=Streptomyces sp. N35 TaxID=2795730 RepID=UPI0018F58E00|nr:acyl carrier protein [Streptomyces sp. N35]
MNRTETMVLIKDSITEIVPDADFTDVGPDDKFRDALELDSLDFVGLVELLSERTGVRIDEDDYPALTTLADVTNFLLGRQN